MEDYKKKYKEAFERARGLLEGMDEGDYFASNEDIENIFPELKESKDERIKKAIIRILKGETRYVSKEDTDKYVAWLEKQGEKKPAENVKTLDADKAIEWLAANVRLYASLNFLYESDCPTGDVEVESLIKSFKKDFGL